MGTRLIRLHEAFTTRQNRGSFNKPLILSERSIFDLTVLGLIVSVVGRNVLPVGFLCSDLDCGPHNKLRSKFSDILPTGDDGRFVVLLYSLGSPCLVGKKCRTAYSIVVDNLLRWFPCF